MTLGMSTLLSPCLLGPDPSQPTRNHHTDFFGKLRATKTTWKNVFLGDFAVEKRHHGWKTLRFSGKHHPPEEWMMRACSSGKLKCAQNIFAPSLVFASARKSFPSLDYDSTPPRTAVGFFSLTIPWRIMRPIGLWLKWHASTTASVASGVRFFDIMRCWVSLYLQQNIKQHHRRACENDWGNTC